MISQIVESHPQSFNYINKIKNSSYRTKEKIVSVNLSAVAQEQFDSEVKHAYQGAITLRECVTARLNVIGDKYDLN